MFPFQATRLRTLRRRSGVMSRVWACTAAAAFSTTVIFADQASPSGLDKGDVNDATAPPFDASAEVSQVDMEIDLVSTSFSAQNAYFFANVSNIVYSTKDKVQELLKSMDGCKGLGDEGNFHWFENEPAESGDSLLELIQDTQGFIAANDEVLVVAFRGSQERVDWLTNLRAFPRGVSDQWNVDLEGCLIHRGFDDAVSALWTPGPRSATGMRQKIKELYGDGKNRKLYLAGHSLGGALATVAAARLVLEDDMNVAGLYTIGSPRVFDSDLADHFDASVNHGTIMKDKHFRGRNHNDAVTRLPTLPYKHCGTEIYFDRFGTISTTSFLDRVLGRLSALLRLSFVDGVSDHTATEYIKHFRNAVIESRLTLMQKTRSVVKDAFNKVDPAESYRRIFQQGETESTKKKETATLEDEL